MITIDRKLNLVIPVEKEDGSIIYIHSTPISTATFEKYWLVLSRTFSAFADAGIMVTSAPSVARLTLKQIAEETPRLDGDWWGGEDGVSGPGGLIADMVRLSQVIDGDTIRPLADILMVKGLDDEVKNEVISYLVFFTAVSRVPPRSDRPKLIRGFAVLYKLVSTSLSATDYASSLKTSTSVDNTGKPPTT